MARYKVIDTSPRFLAEGLEKQLLPGSLEHAVLSWVGERDNLLLQSSIAIRRRPVTE